MANFIAPSVDLPNDDPDIIMFGAEGIQLTSPFETIMLDKRQYDAEVSVCLYVCLSFCLHDYYYWYLVYILWTSCNKRG